MHARASELQEEHARLKEALDRARVAIEGKSRAGDDLVKDVELAKLEAENLLAERVSRDLEVGVKCPFFQGLVALGLLLRYLKPLKAAWTVLSGSSSKSPLAIVMVLCSIVAEATPKL